MSTVSTGRLRLTPSVQGKQVVLGSVEVQRTDPLRETLRRCQQLGEAAASDTDCLAAWAESRDRFLGRDRSEAR